MKVEVCYLFSRNEKIGSKFIAWGTKHLSDKLKIPSHVAILVNNRWVFESTALNGVRVISYKKWLSINEEIAKIPYNKDFIEYSKIKGVYRTIESKKYDWIGVVYFAWHVALNKFFKRKIPNINKWENPNKYFCSEAVSKLTHDTYYGMKAPVQILSDLR